MPGKVAGIPREHVLAFGLSLFVALALGRCLWTFAPLEPDFGPLPAFEQMRDIGARKAAFFEYLTPIIEFHNKQVEKQRQRLQVLREKLLAGDSVNFLAQRWLANLGSEYGLDCTQFTPLSCTKLLLPRVDVVPLELALAQAARESGWGRSQFAREGNNLFAQLCYRPGCGIVPERRAVDESHELASYPDTSAAVRSYILSVNTDQRYAGLRELRARLRSQELQVNGFALAGELDFHAERRSLYVDEVRATIRSYKAFEASM